MSPGADGGLPDQARHWLPATCVILRRDLVGQQRQAPHDHCLTGLRLRLLPLVSPGQEALERLVVIAVAGVADGAHVGLGLGLRRLGYDGGLGVF